MVGTGLVVMFPVAGHNVRPQIALHAEIPHPNKIWSVAILGILTLTAVISKC